MLEISVEFSPARGRKVKKAILFAAGPVKEKETRNRGAGSTWGARGRAALNSFHFDARADHARRPFWRLSRRKPASVSSFSSSLWSAPDQGANRRRFLVSKTRRITNPVARQGETVQAVRAPGPWFPNVSFLGSAP